MRKNYVFFTIIFSLFTLCSAFAQQSVKEVLIANSGKFETSNITDYATIGAYNTSTGIYSLFDTVMVQSVQDLVIEGDFAYLAAQDSIVKYNLKTYQRVAIAYFPAIYSLEVSDNYLLAGRWYGSAPGYFTAFNKSDLSFAFSLNDINNTINDIEVIGDTAYASFNIKGKVNIYADSIGKIAIIDLKNKQFVNTLDLGTQGAGINKLFKSQNTIYGISSVRKSLLTLNTLNRQFTQESIGISKGTALDDNILYGTFGKGIGAYNLTTKAIINESIVDSNFIASEYDTINKVFYLSNTDYVTFGDVQSFNSNGDFIKKFDVQISPEAMAIHYENIVTGLAESDVIPNNLEVFPNPGIDYIIIKGLQLEEVIISIFDLNGNIKVTEAFKMDNGSLVLNIADLPSGSYFVKIAQNDHTSVQKFYKQ